MSVRYDRFELDRDNVAKIAVGKECRRMVRSRAQLAKTYAESLSQGIRSDADDDDDGVHYQDSFEVSAGLAFGITPQWPMTRAAAYLANTAPHAYLIEFGYDRPVGDASVVEVPGHFILTDTLEFLEGFDRRVESDIEHFSDDPDYDYDDGDDGYEDPLSWHDWADG